MRGMTGVTRNLGRRLGAAVAVAAIATLGLAACAGPGATGSSGSPKERGVLNVTSVSAPSTLNPAASGNGSDAVYQQLAYAPLIQIDSEGALVPGLAEKWGYEGEGNTTFSLTLRDGLKFADGTPLDGAAVAASLNYFAKNATGPAAAAFSTLSAAADGAKGVTITSSVANPVIADLVSTRFLGGNIISPAGLASPDALGTKTFGAGAYVLDSDQSLSGDHYTFVPNKNYYDQKGIHFDKVVVKVVTNPSSAIQAMKTGQIDAVAGDSTTVKSARDAGLTVLNAPSSWTGAFVLDTAGEVTPALGKVEVRQAMNYAIDRTAIAKAVFGEFASPVQQPNDPGFDAFDEKLEGTYDLDLAKARSLLADAGYPDGFTVTWAYPTYEPQTAKVVQAMASQLSEIGIKAELHGAANITELITMLTSKENSLWSLQWGGQSQFANTKQVWLAGSQVNPFGHVAPGLDAAFQKYSEASVDDRDATAQAVERILVENAVSIPVAKVDTIYYHVADLKGVALQKTGEINNVIYWSR